MVTTSSILKPPSKSFKISNANKEIIVSVLDFTGDPDTVVIPQWLFYNLYPLQLGDIVSVSVYSGGYTNNKLSKGTCITLRPHTIDFLDIVIDYSDSKPTVSLKNSLTYSFLVTLTHEKSLAVAVVISEKNSS